MNNTPRDHDVQAEFLHQMYGVATGYATLVFHKADGFKRELPYQIPDQIAEMAAKAVELAPQGNVYFGTTVRQEPNRQQSNPAVERVWLHLDLDEKFGDVESPEILEKIATLGALVVLSGTGKNKHVYVRLSRSVDKLTFDMLEASLNSWFGGKPAGVDDKIRDNDILRIPGTINHKPDAGPVELAEQYGYDASISWTPDELLGMMPRVEPSNSVDAGSDAITPIPTAIPTSVTTALDEQTSDRSSKTPKIVNACKGAGLTIEQTTWVLLQDNDQAARYADKGQTFMYSEIRRLFATSAATPVTQAEEDFALIAGDIEIQTVEAKSTSTGSWLDDGWDDFDETLEPEKATVFGRCDGLKLLYPGRTHTFMGESESGKSFLAQIVCAEEMVKGNQILYVDFEDTKRGIFQRFVQLGVPVHVIKSLATVVNPDSRLDVDDPRWIALISKPYSVAVLDGVTEVMTLQGLDPNVANDVAKFQNTILNRVCNLSGAATIQIDHQNKSTDTRGRFASGSQHKMSGISGVSYVITPKESIAPGQQGTLRIQLGKDRVGGVAAGLGKRGKNRLVDAADVVIDSTQKYTVWNVVPPKIFDDLNVSKEDRIVLKIAEVLQRKENEFGLNRTDLKKLVGGRATDAADQIERMLMQGWAIETGEGRSKKIVMGTQPEFQTSTLMNEDKYLMESE